ncbi:unnamed protein product, partial [Allacma fusca]
TKKIPVKLTPDIRMNHQPLLMIHQPLRMILIDRIFKTIIRRTLNWKFKDRAHRNSPESGATDPSVENTAVPSRTPTPFTNVLRGNTHTSSSKSTCTPPWRPRQIHTNDPTNSSIANPYHKT